MILTNIFHLWIHLRKKFLMLVAESKMMLRVLLHNVTFIEVVYGNPLTCWSLFFFLASY